MGRTKYTTVLDANDSPTLVPKLQVYLMKVEAGIGTDTLNSQSSRVEGSTVTSQ